MRDRSIIVDLFQGQLRSTVICAACGHMSICFDPFMYLSVPLVHSDGMPLNVERCIEDFSSEERLDGEDAWYCGKCAAHVQARKRIELWKLPPVLIIHLKRFSMDSVGRTSKVSLHVNFPLLDLNLTRYCRSPQRDYPLYDCFAVINHHGDAGMGRSMFLLVTRTTA